MFPEVPGKFQGSLQNKISGLFRVFLKNPATRFQRSPQPFLGVHVTSLRDMVATHNIGGRGINNVMERIAGIGHI